MNHAQRPASRRIVPLLLLLCMGAAALSGCGQKGNLYLPDRPEQQPSRDDDDNNNTT